MPAHLVESVVSHLSIQAAKIKEVVANVTRLEKENNALRKQIVKMTKDLQRQAICTPLCPVDLTMSNFEKQKEENTVWRSPPLYTDLKGYKLCLGVYPNGYGIFKDQCVSIYLELMKGEFDDQLKWPFVGKFWIQLLNQDQDRHR